MPTLLRKDGFKFFFYANEHEPKHVHVMKGGGFAKINLTTLVIVSSCLSVGDLKKAVKITKEYREEFERRWDEFFQR